MAENDWLIGLTAGLDENKSKEQIKKDIENLRKILDSIEFQVKLSADQKKEIKEQLDKLEIGLDNIHISGSALKGLVEQVNNALNKIEIAGLNVGGTDVVNQVKQLGQKINQGIVQGVDNTSILDSFKKSLANMGMGSEGIDSIASRIQNLGIQIETLNKQQSIAKNNTISVTISGLDQYGQAIKLTEQYNTETGELIKSIDNVSTVQQKAGGVIESFSKSKSREINNLTNQINQLNRAANDSNAARPIKDSVHLKTISDSYNDIISGIEKMKNASRNTFIEEQNNVKTLISNYKSLISEFRNAENIASQMKSTDITSGVAQAQERLGKLKANSSGFEQMAQTIKELDVAIENVGDKSSLDKFINDLRVAEAQLGRVKAEAKQVEGINEILLSMEGKNTKNKNYDYQIDTEIRKLKDLGFTDEEVTQKVKILTDAQAELKRVIDSNNFDSIVEKNKAIVNADNERTIALNQVRTAYGELKNDVSQYYNLTKQTKLSNSIQNWLSKNTRASKSAKESLNAYYKELNGGRVPVSRLEYIEKELKTLDAEQRGLGKLGKNLKDQFSQAAESFAQWMSVSSVIMGAVYKAKEAVSELKEINTLVTEISKANDQLSKSELEDIAGNSFGVSSKYGKKATDYLSGVQEASRAGYENAEAIAELSVAAQGAGDMTAELANKYIIATDKAYKLGGSVEKLTEILDGSNYITNHNAVNMTELAEGMSIVGSQAASLGVKADETTAVLGTMIATTKQSGSEMARAFRAILLNLQQVTDEEEGIDAEGLTKYEEACKALNVSLKETKNGITSLRNPMEVLKDLSVEYSKLDANDIRRTNLLSSVGGKLRANALNALLENYDMYSQMLEQYAQGTGSMAAEAEKTANSWEGSLNRLSNTWTDTVENIADSDAIITVINGLNGALSVINNITDALGSVGTIGAGIGIAASIKNVGRDKM